VRVRVANDNLNNPVANGAPLRFDTIDSDTDGYASASLPIDRLVIPPGLGGLYLLTGEATTSGNQGTSIGIGVRINGQEQLSTANQFITGPGSISYALHDHPTQIGYLRDGDTVQIYNTSTSPSPNAFTNVFLALARLG
jgi:hypothetical protein